MLPGTTWWSTGGEACGKHFDLKVDMKGARMFGGCSEALDGEGESITNAGIVDGSVQSWSDSCKKHNATDTACTAMSRLFGVGIVLLVAMWFQILTAGVVIMDIFPNSSNVFIRLCPFVSPLLSIVVWLVSLFNLITFLQLEVRTFPFTYKEKEQLTASDTRTVFAIIAACTSLATIANVAAMARSSKHSAGKNVNGRGHFTLDV